MTKEKPEQFDEAMDCEFELYKTQITPSNWTHTEFIGTYENYYLYLCWDFERKDGGLFRTKIENATKKKIYECCGQEIK